MAFSKTRGGKKKVRAIVVIRSKGGTPKARKAELKRFKNEVRKLAKRYGGSVRSISR